MRHRETCGVARRMLLSDGKPDDVAPRELDAKRHVAECAACRAFFDDMRQISDRIRMEAPRPRAPNEVRDRLLSAVRVARGSRIGRRPRWLVQATTVAAALAVAAALVVRRADLGLGSRTASQFLSAVVDDHVRSLAADRIDAPDREVVARWLRQRIAFAVDIPSFPGGALRGAHLCLIDGRRGAVLDYEVDGRPVAYYVVSDGTDDRAPMAPPRLAVAARAGYHAVVWHQAGLAYALVGTLPSARLTVLAHLCIEQMVGVAQSGRNFGLTVSYGLRE